MAEVAVLHYGGGPVHLMTHIEAEEQMKGASKLPREAWKHVRLLQMPVQSVRVGTPTRYITYEFDAYSTASKPQAPIREDGESNTSRANGMGMTRSPSKARGREAERVAAVPPKINACLASFRKGQAGAGLELVSGLFEFVLDEADGDLWLVNASHLKCRRTKSEEESDSRPPEAEVRYFEEEEFAEVMRQEEMRFDSLRRKFGKAKEMALVASGGSPAMAERAASRGGSTGDELAPPELWKFYEAGEEMRNFYDQEIVPFISRGYTVSNDEGTKAVGLGVWFQRWVRRTKSLGEKVQEESRERQRLRRQRAKPSIEAES